MNLQARPALVITTEDMRQYEVTVEQTLIRRTTVTVSVDESGRSPKTAARLMAMLGLKDADWTTEEKQAYVVGMRAL